MKIEIYEDEYYPVFIPTNNLLSYIGKPRKKRRGVYEIGDNIYKEWIKIFDDFHNTQKEIKRMVEKAERKRRRSICGFKLK